MGETTNTKAKLLQELLLYATLSCLVLFGWASTPRHISRIHQKSPQIEEATLQALGTPSQTHETISPSFYYDVISCDVVNPEHIDVEFESIGASDGIKQVLFELVILPLHRPQLFARGKLLGPQKVVVLYGLPGTGEGCSPRPLRRSLELCSSMLGFQFDEQMVWGF